ncbi:thiamine phosphate synthase [Puniceibacterium confluentis]|uniref:thiamine phosphate synthase n=1 Tax=Puniceibacterium confluentis TaxID=1958944 RepID=UPI0011B7A202|nr:thiamine phosphate synthase [Puniceibacterium confluentis]
MAETEHPQIYLITPPEFDLSTFPQTLAGVLDSAEVACIRLALSTRDEDRILRAADAVRDVAHQYDIALVLDTHVVLAQRLGLDGVHLLDGARSVRWARKELGDDAIVGAYCAQSRHEGMAAGESGADYISFGPVGPTALGDGAVVDPELFKWWSEVIELPCVAEGALGEEQIASLSSVTDFFAFGAEIWESDNPGEALARLTRAITG